MTLAITMFIVIIGGLVVVAILERKVIDDIANEKREQDTIKRMLEMQEYR